MKTLVCYIATILAVWQAHAQTMHLVLLSDVEDLKLGFQTIKDEERVVNFFEFSARNLGYQFKAAYLNKQNFTAQAAKETIEKLATTPNDIICFYYFGLGYFLPNSQYPAFKVKKYQNTPLTLDNIGDVLLAKKARLRLAFADCREDISFVRDTVYTDLRSTFVAKIDFTKPLLKSIFLDECGLIKVSATAPNEKATIRKTILAKIHSRTRESSGTDTISNGANFTHIFLNQMDRFLNRTWESIPDANFQYVFQDTKTVFSFQSKSSNGRIPIQTPNWNIKSCQTPNVAFADMTATPTRIPPNLKYPVGDSLIELSFNHLISLRKTEDRKAYSGRLKDIFSQNVLAEEQGKVTSLIPSNGRNVEKKERIFLVDKYFKTLETYNPKLIQIKVNKTKSLLEAVTYIELTETWKK
jgi:hypothetical protein